MDNITNVPMDDDLKIFIKECEDALLRISAKEKDTDELIDKFGRYVVFANGTPKTDESIKKYMVDNRGIAFKSSNRTKVMDKYVELLAHECEFNMKFSVYELIDIDDEGELIFDVIID